MLVNAPMSRVLCLAEDDPVGIALADLAVGDAIGFGRVTARDAIPRGHKVALHPIATGAAVRKLGATIGRASRDIAPGEHVHVHNLAFVSAPFGRGGGATPHHWPISDVADARRFDGYVREDGRVGTRNVLLVLSTVNCSATVVRRIAEAFRRRVDLTAFPSIDGVVALSHQHGCSVRADGPGMAMLRRTLAGYAAHPNVAGTVLVGLGCEDNQIDLFLHAAGLSPSPRLRPLVIQEIGGTAATIEAGVEALITMLPPAAAMRRTPVGLDRLVVGLQCGGSDAFSAISANPALGLAVDRLVAAGGTAILAETPEIYGAEQLLLDRAATPEVARDLLARLRWWEENARADLGGFDTNPSPGNKAGGITTILEKSLGAIAKSGASPLTGVYDYAAPVDRHGLVFMDSPGFDPVSATGQVASGANLICFTTGRGSCFGCAPVPSIKISTNTGLYQRMAGDIDLDCGTVLDRIETLAQASTRLFDLMIETASGRRTKSEALGYGEDEFIPWTPGLVY